LSDFRLQDAIGQRLLDKSGIFIVRKVTRAGASITLTKIGSTSGKRIVVVEPNKKILREVQRIITEIAGNQVKTALILPNDELCRKLNKIPELKFQLKENCFNCEFNNSEECKLQNIIEEDHNVYLLTYHKLQVLQNSETQESQELLKKLQDCHVFILDEFTRAILLSIFTLTIQEIDKNGNVTKIRKELEELRRISERTQSTFECILWSTIDFFLDQCEKITKDGVYSNEIIQISSEEDNKKAFAISWRLITQLTEAGYDTELLQDLTLLSFSEKFDFKIETSKHTASPILEDALGYLREFCNALEENKAIFIIDSCLPTINFKKVLQKDVIDILWGPKGDPLQTNAQQILISDTAHWSSVNFIRSKNLQNRIKNYLKALLKKFSPENVLLVATNKKIINIVSHWNLPKSLKMNWFRSDLMRGVSVGNRRVLVLIGGPYLPKAAYVRESESFDFNELVSDLRDITEEEKKIEISRLLRVFDTKSELINAIGRPKDPRGESRSVVFLFGMQKFEVLAMLNQTGAYNVSMPYVVEPIRKGGFMKDSLIIAELWLDKDIKDLTSKSVDDLPIISRIIRLMESKARFRTSEVVPHETRRVISVAKRNREILKHFNIKLRRIQGGYIFEK